MSAATPEDLANGIKLLERLRNGELMVTAGSGNPANPGEVFAMLERVEVVLRNAYTRTVTPIGDGGPAYPTDQSQPEREDGMSLRDHFAGKAMAQLISGPAAQNICDRDPRYDETNFAAVVAINAYEFADAMLKARQA